MNKKQRAQWNYMNELRHHYLRSDTNKAHLDIRMDQLMLGTLEDWYWKDTLRLGRFHGFLWSKYKLTDTAREPTIQSYPKLRLV